MTLTPRWRWMDANARGTSSPIRIETPMQVLSIGVLLVVFAATLIMGIATTRFSITIGRWLGIVDRPDPRKAHRDPIPCLGGLGMLLAFQVGVLVLLFAVPDLAVLRRSTFLGVLAGAVAIFLVGAFDDLRPIPAVVKLFLQVAVASGMWWFGVRVEILSFLGDGAGGGAIGPLFSYCVTVGWYVALMNSINLVDGLDGLAGGISMIGALSLVGVFLVLVPSPEVVIGGYLAVLTAGAAGGFLVFNWHPARTFMGDGGSLLLGYLLATASMIGSAKTPTLLALAVPLVALGVPLFETVFSFLRRALSGKHPFQPDRRHIHHRLLDVGLDQRRVVVILLFMTAFLGINAVILAQAESKIVFFNVVLLVLGLILLIENLRFLEKRRNGHTNAGR